MNIAAFGSAALAVLVAANGGLRQREAARQLLKRFHPEHSGDDALARMEKLLSEALRTLAERMPEFAVSDGAPL